MEPDSVASWTTWYGKNLFMPCSCSENIHTFVSSVRHLHYFLLSPHLKHESYSHARLLEINSHSLFSKWFSESGKLVQRLFHSITELVEEEDSFVVVLIGIHFPFHTHTYIITQTMNDEIDEVESLTAARAGAMAGTEPSDGLRVCRHFTAFFLRAYNYTRS
jgi:hypothetical protein